MNTTILTNLPEKKQKSKKKLITIIVIAVLLVLVLVFTISVSVVAEGNDTDSRQIAEYEYQINELRKQKEKCYNDLTYDESIKTKEGFIKPCVQWDEEIMAIREKADALKHKSYEVGLK